MLIARGTLLARLNEATAGVSSKEILEQSNSFVFKDGRLTTFNDEIMVRVSSPLDFDCVVNATDLMQSLAKFPDEQVEVKVRDNELVIKGKKKKAGLVCSMDVRLPLDAVPMPGEDDWHRIEDGILGALQQAARTCGNDDSQYLTTVVHVTPDKVEACDNFRLLRVTGQTGFPAEILIPATSIHAVEGLEITHVAVERGWAHLRTTGGAIISCRSSMEKYHDGLDSLLELEDPEKIILPSNLVEILERAEVFSTAGDSKVTVCIDDGEMRLTSRKEGGWYKETKNIKYEGRRLEFDINPKFLAEVLQRTRDVQVDDKRMKIQAGGTHFVVALVAKSARNEIEDDDEPVPVGKSGGKQQEFNGDDIPF